MWLKYDKNWLKPTDMSNTRQEGWGEKGWDGRGNIWVPAPWDVRDDTCGRCGNGGLQPISPYPYNHA
eukprot:CAMPEP_0114553884 /NCGR_PEP_ID=MMETSP0114-20121206/7906_1 /TAXON_ID=31324 /ORGANISM="Goniomonas sp, Strain m" /LENGTH=66 /DNA_ID=CAMNT_0001738877 /DNA_START=188 /DNA_END=388 /DNA_ORIENTATION=-